MRIDITLSCGGKKRNFYFNQTFHFRVDLPMFWITLPGYFLLLFGCFSLFCFQDLTCDFFMDLPKRATCFIGRVSSAEQASPLRPMLLNRRKKLNYKICRKTFLHNFSIENSNIRGCHKPILFQKILGAFLNEAVEVFETNPWRSFQSSAFN